MKILLAVTIAVAAWLVNHPVIIAVFIAVAGWIVAHALTIRAQNKHFITQVINDARLDITRAIRDYQDWLSKVQTTIFTLPLNIICQEEGFSRQWSLKIAELIELFYRDRSALKWIFCLEEYEILFPTTAECRKHLLDRQTQIQQFLHSFLRELQSTFLDPAALEHRKKAIDKAQKNVGIVADQIGLMEDLRIYLQNLCLSSFTGYKIPERKPEDLSVPRLVQNQRGNLQIKENQKQRQS